MEPFQFVYQIKHGIYWSVWCYISTIKHITCFKIVKFSFSFLYILFKIFQTAIRFGSKFFTLKLFCFEIFVVSNILSLLEIIIIYHFVLINAGIYNIIMILVMNPP